MTEAVYVIIIAPLVQGGSPANICQTKKRKCVRPNFGVNNNFKFKISLYLINVVRPIKTWHLGGQWPFLRGMRWCFELNFKISFRIDQMLS